VIAKTFSATVLGIDAHLIEVEVDVSVLFQHKSNRRAV